MTNLMDQWHPNLGPLIKIKVSDDIRQVIDVDVLNRAVDIVPLNKEIRVLISGDFDTGPNSPAYDALMQSVVDYWQGRIPVTGGPFVIRINQDDPEVYIWIAYEP